MDDGTGYDRSDPKHPEYHSTHADYWDAREKERQEKLAMTKYEITLRDHADLSRWTFTILAENFGDAERRALGVLQGNNDESSEIMRIELW